MSNFSKFINPPINSLVLISKCGKIDNLTGLKENVIVGCLIPAGPGKMTTEYEKIAKIRDQEILEQRNSLRENAEISE